MTMQSKGGAFESRGRFFIRVTVAAQKRRAALVPWATSLEQATERARVVQDLVSRLRAAGRTSHVDALVSKAADADDDLLLVLIAEVNELANTTPLGRPRRVRGRDDDERSYIRWLEQQVEALEARLASLEPTRTKRNLL